MWHYNVAVFYNIHEPEWALSHYFKDDDLLHLLLTGISFNPNKER